MFAMLKQYKDSSESINLFYYTSCISVIHDAYMYTVTRYSPCLAMVCFCFKREISVKSQSKFWYLSRVSDKAKILKNM